MEESALFSRVLVRKHQAEGPEDAHHLALGVQRSARCSPTPSAQSRGAHSHARTGLPAAPSAAVTAPDVTHPLTSEAALRNSAVSSFGVTRGKESSAALFVPGV